jgi:CHAD domain-containing protein
MDDLPEEPGVAVLRERAERHCDKGYEKAQRALRSRRYFGLMTLLRAWAEGRSWHDGNSTEATEKMRGPAVDVAHDLLAQHFQAVVDAGRDFHELNDERRHALRIEIKKMRYAAEFFRSLYPKQASVDFVDAIKTLQDALGANNDLAVARELLAGLAKHEKGKRRAQAAYATGLVLGWHNHVSNNREQNLSKLWEDLVANRPFWDTKKAEPASSEWQFVITDEAREPDPKRETEPVVKAKPGTRTRTKAAPKIDS